MMRFKHPYENLPDEQLMNMVAHQDRRAFEVLYGRYSKLILNYFYRMLWKDRERARDFTQELFTKIIHKPQLFDVSRSFKTWLYSIANNMCKNEYAKHEVRVTAKEEISFFGENTEKPEEGQTVDKELFKIKLKEALDEMDEVKRTTFDLRFYQELSIAEISEIMQCSEGTVKSRLFYMLKELNKKLKVFEGIAVWILIAVISLF